MEGDAPEFEFKILDPDGFAEWAKTGGRAIRDDQGEIEKDKDGRPRYRELSEKTIAAEKNILRQLETSLGEQGIDPAFIPDALKEFKKHLRTKVKGRKPKAGTKPKKVPKSERGVSEATIERYLVVCRRYYRFHREVKQGRQRPPTKTEAFQGPALNTHPRGRIVGPKEFNSWVSLLERQDPRVVFATWLVLAGVPVDSLTELRFGTDLKRVGGQIELSGVGERQLEQPGVSVLSAAYVPRKRVFVSAAASNPHPDGRLTTSGLRRLWAEARKVHQVEFGEPGPTMRDIQTIGDRVDLNYDGTSWAFVPRTIVDSPEYKRD